MAVNAYADHTLKYAGRVWTYREIAAKLGIEPPSIHARKKAGWTAAEIVEVPARKAPERFEKKRILRFQDSMRRRARRPASEDNATINTVFALKASWIPSCAQCQKNRLGTCRLTGEPAINKCEDFMLLRRVPHDLLYRPVADNGRTRTHRSEEYGITVVSNRDPDTGWWKRIIYVDGLDGAFTSIDAVNAAIEQKLLARG